jgi:hypothetical protein
MKLKTLIKGYDLGELGVEYFKLKGENKKQHNARNSLRYHLENDLLDKDLLLQALTIINLNAAQRVSEYFGDF